jgi:hypothetical protein
MKNIFKYLGAVLIMMSVASCDPYDTWPEGLPELEHVYYVSNVKTGNGTEQDLQHEIAANGTARFLNRIHYNPAPPAGTPLTEWVESGEKNVTCPMRIRFISERVRSYTVETFFWVETRSGDLVAGTDYSVITESGSQLSPNSSGAYSLSWPQALKGEQSVKIKRLSAKVGELRLVFLDRSRVTFTATDAPDRNDLEKSLLNNKTGDYTIRGLWHDYRYPVIVKFQ